MVDDLSDICVALELLKDFFLALETDFGCVFEYDLPLRRGAVIAFTGLGILLGSRDADRTNLAVQIWLWSFCATIYASFTPLSTWPVRRDDAMVAPSRSHERRISAEK